MKYSIKVEIIKHKRYFVARDDKGRFKGRRKYAGSRLNKESASKIFKKNKTFRKDIKKHETLLTNVREITRVKDTTIDNRYKPVKLKRPKGKTVMYQVSGYFNNKLIVANSQSSNEKDARGMKEEAWESFLERVSQAAGGQYDADEGLEHIGQVTNIREGWVSYWEK